MRSSARRKAPAPADPYFVRARATRFASFGKARWCHVLLQFASSQDARAFAAHNPRPQSPSAEAETEVWVPSMYAAPPKGMEKWTWCSALVKIAHLPTLYSAAMRNATGIRRIQLGTPIRLGEGWASQLSSVRSPRTLTQISSPGAVVTGIIDDGLAIAHERFRIADQTRIECFWDQVEPDANPQPNWNYGRELCKYNVGATPGIDTWLKRCTHAGIVDEDEFYLRTGLIDFGSSGHKATARRSSHGTHVMDLACGEDRSTVQNDRPIICVQLPSRTTADTSGATLAPQVLDALWYLADRAGTLPLVINLSYGLFSGPHDGSDELEIAIREFLRLRNNVAPTAIVLPAGNSHLARCHARFRLGTGPNNRSHRLNWKILPDDRTASILEVWLPYRGSTAPRVKVRVVTPANVASAWVVAGQTFSWGPAGPVVCVIAYDAPAGASSRSRIRITLNPTSTTDPGIPLASPGLWRVEIQNDSSAPIRGVDAWIQRDDAPHGYPRLGRQSHFEDSAYVRFANPSGREEEEDDPASHVKRRGTINAIATGDDPVVVGGCRRSDLAAAKYSARGVKVRAAGQSPRRRDPDAMAVSEDSVACHGMLAAGSRSGTVVAINGTSIAAPQITRELAKVLATGVNPRNHIHALAQGQETGPRPHPPYQPKPPANRGGQGRIVLPPVVPVKRFEP